MASAKLLAPQAAADALRSALDLWHGPAFGELGDLRTKIPACRNLLGERIVRFLVVTLHIRFGLDFYHSRG